MSSLCLWHTLDIPIMVGGPAPCDWPAVWPHRVTGPTVRLVSCGWSRAAGLVRLASPCTNHHDTPRVSCTFLHYAAREHEIGHPGTLRAGGLLQLRRPRV